MLPEPADLNAPLNLRYLTINQAAYHRIKPRRKGDPCAEAIPGKAMNLPDDVLEMLRIRLADATGGRSRAHQLDIGKFEAGSFFHDCQSLPDQDDAAFFEASKRLASRLAEVQLSTTLPEGYLWFLWGITPETGKKVFIIIKAELHDALMLKEDSCSVLREVFLSPTQKLFKIGIIYERAESQADTAFPNSDYGCLLFDKNWKGSVKSLANYFCSDFLGFTYATIAKYQTADLVEKFTDFVKSQVKDVDQQAIAMDGLRVGIMNEVKATISPDDLRNVLPADEEIQKRFLNSVVDKLPGTIVIDRELISRKLSMRNVHFAGDIIINGPSDDFAANVQVLESPDRMRQFALDLVHDLDTGKAVNFTVVRINGKRL